MAAHGRRESVARSGAVSRTAVASLRREVRKLLEGHHRAPSRRDPEQLRQAWGQAIEFLDISTSQGLLVSGNNILAFEVHNAIITSSDHVFDVGLWYSSEVEVVEPLPLGSTWKYDNTFSDLGTAWREPAFDDSGWLTGAAPLGFESRRIVNTELPLGVPAHYFRVKFNIEDDLANIDSLFVIGNYDDGMVACEWA